MDWTTITNYLHGFSLGAVVIRLLLATILGGVVGMERERLGHAAGFRTHILVCIGAAMTVMTGVYSVQVLGFSGDPMRIAAQVVSGIGFIGAGTILITRQTNIKGLTTAAGLWATASVGLAVGAGFYTAAILCSIIIFIVMRHFVFFDYKYSPPTPMRLYIELESIRAVNSLLDEASNMGIPLDDIKVNPPYSGSPGHVGIEASLPATAKEANTADILQTVLSMEHVAYALRIE
ncbi:MgtC/SapB family protein [Eubacteriales bacterium OttesenSCG-928-N14]|nr:MgtC/SapB family protein [Eubacteriales bacterium OttesenSCG-928-N14]